MGCDIHLCVEKRRIKKGWLRCCKPKPNSSEWEKRFEPMNEELEWRSCDISSDRPWSDRHYGMFAKLADVRNYDDLEHLPIRGFPKDANFKTFYEYTLRIVPDENYNLDSDGIVSESTAKKWIEDGSSEEITLLNMPKYWRDFKFINNPDYHSPNWCSLKELEEAVKERCLTAKQQIKKLFAAADTEGYKLEIVYPLDIDKIGTPEHDNTKLLSWWIGEDLKLLMECDAVFFCFGYDISKGCQLEYRCAEIYEKKILCEDFLNFTNECRLIDLVNELDKQV